MKKLKLFFACLLMAVLSIGQVWGAAITVNANPTESGTFTISADKASGQNAPLVTGGLLRLYAKNTLTISTSGSANITAMTIAWTKNGTKTFATVSTETGSYTHPSAAGDGTWTGSANEIVFTVGSSGQIQITSVDITVEEGGSTKTTITDEQLAWSAASATVTMGATDNVFPSLTNSIPVSVTYQSTDETVATISNTGVVSILKAGSTTIKAVFAEDETYNAKTVQYTLTVNPEPLTPIEGGIIDELSITDFGVTSSSYTAFSAKQASNTGHSDAVYAGKVAKNSTNIQMNSIGSSNAGREIATTTSGGNAKRVEVIWGGTNTANRTLTVYGSTTAYSGEETASSGTSLGVITYTANAVSDYIDISGDYPYIQLLASGAMYFAKINITWVAADVSKVATPAISGTDNFFSTSEISISCSTDDATIYYTTDGNDPTTSSTAYTAPFNVDETTTVKAIAVKDGITDSDVAEQTFTKATVLTVAQARTAIDAGGDLTNKYVAGIISQIDSYNSTYHSITYWISDDGTTTDQLQVYSGLAGIVKAEFTSVEDLNVGDDVTVNGTLKKYSSTYEFDKNNVIVARKPIARLAWAGTTEGAYAASLEGGNTFPTLTNSDGVSVSYSSSETSYASFSDASDYSTLTLNAVGSTVITATFAGNSSFKANSASYTLNVSSSVIKADISFECNGAASCPEDELAASNLPSPLPAITKAGYNFGGWFMDSEFNTPAVAGDAVASTDPITLYAKWLDPYNIAAAKAVIDATPAGTANQYVAGKISQIDSYNNTYHSITYWISDDGTTTDQIQVYSGLIGNAATPLGKEQFSAVTDLELGDEVVVFGTLKLHNSTTYEFDKNNTIYSFNRPEKPTITADPEAVENVAVEGVTDQTIALTYENIENYLADVTLHDDAAGETAFTGSWLTASVSDADNYATLTYSVAENDGAARTAYMKVYAVGDDDKEATKIIPVSQVEYVAPAEPAELPFAFDGGRADIASTQGMSQEGLDTDYGSSPKLKFNTTGDYVIINIASDPGKLTYDIIGNGFSGGTFKVQESVNGVDYTDVATYTELGAKASEEQTLLQATRFVKFIYTEKVSGNVALGNIAIAEYVAPAAVETPAFSPAGGEYAGAQSVTISCETVGATIYYTTDGTDPDNESTQYTSAITVDESKTIKAIAYKGDDHSEIASATYTITPALTDYYEKVTSGDVAEGTYLIVYEAGNVAFNGGLETLDASSNTIAVNITNENKIGVTETTAAATFYIDPTAGTIKSASGRYIGRTANTNGLNASETEAYTNTISIDGDGNAVIVGSGSTATYLRYNPSQGQTRFRYFTQNQQMIALYKLANEVIKPASGLAWDPADDIEITVGGAFSAPTLSNPNNIPAGDITIASSNTELATVTNGEVALVENAIGTTTITATYTGETYKPITVSYKIKVNPANSIYVSSLNVNFGSVAKDAVVADKTITVTLTNVAAASAVLSGSGASAFSIDKAALTESGDITISASSATAGTFAATLTISDDAGLATSKEVSLSLTVTDEEPSDEETPVSTTSKWVPATAIEDGMQVLITGVKSDDVYAMGEQKNNNRAAVAASVDGEGVLTPGENTMAFTLVAQGDGTYALRTSNGKYLYAAASGSNYLKTQDEVDVNAKWTMTVASASAEGSSNRHVMQFNTGSTLFSCYASAGGSGMAAIQFYVPKPVVTYVAQIGDNKYESLPAAVAAAEDGQTVNLLMDVAAGPGVMITSAEHKQIIIDFGNHTYCATSPVGSAGTENQAFHFEKGCNITLQNGTITSSGDEIIMLIQNYGDLTLLNITLIGNNLPGEHRYVLSNNCGNVVIGAGTTITAKPGDVAFNVCVTNDYPEGTQVTVKDGATITGIVEYGVWGTIPADNKATLTIEGGELNVTWNVDPALAEDAKDNINVQGGTFNAEVPADYCAHGYIPEDNGSGQYGVYYAGYYERGSLTPGNYATICLPYAGKISGAKLFDLEYYDGVSTLYLLEVNGNAMVAGRPYIFLPSSDKIEVTYTDNAGAEAGSFNGLVGSLSLVAEEIEANAENYILYNNQYWLVNSKAYVGANRAYIHMDGVPTEPSTPQVGQAPRRRVAMAVNGKQTTTGIDALNATEAPVKMIIDGQIFILRGEKMYDTTGRLVK